MLTILSLHPSLPPSLPLSLSPSRSRSRSLAGKAAHMLTHLHLHVRWKIGADCWVCLKDAVCEVIVALSWFPCELEGDKATKTSKTMVPQP